MRHLAACIALVGLASTASAEPRRHKKKHRHHHPHVEAVVDPEPSELVDEPTITPHVPHPREWSIAVGPNVWMASVDANVSVGSGNNVGAGVGFFQIEEHTRFGVPLLGEARWRRFSLVADVLYGVIDIDGAHAVGPLNVGLNGSASSLMVDGFAGYMVAGDSFISVEARAGVRYQRTAVAGTLEVGGSPLASASEVDAGADALAGSRVFVRPWDRVFFVGAADMGLFGASSKTWSASADASVHITSHVLASLGWRTMTMDRGYIGMVMHGPRATLQVTF
jgi:hypothetical protein